ncbi:MAG: MaoC family dehydratase [Actinomycetota bacterium]|nr:MaoC family dehydratase N-terminal domain-containing protein [Actinomycetota bacterium]
MGTFDDLSPGDTFSTPSRAFTSKDLATLVSIGGYTHPLFTDAAFAAASPFGNTPAPGQALLLLMGGLVEQSGKLDRSTIGLIGFESVRFAAPAFPGDTLTVHVAVKDKERSKSGRRGSLLMAWQCENGHGEILVKAEATMLFRLD